MYFNDDAAGEGVANKGSVTSTSIDLTAAEAPLFLEFESFFTDGDYNADETAMIHISVDEGETWELLYDVPGAGDWTSFVVNMDAHVGQTIWLTFEYDDGGGWNYGWCFDDVVLADQPLNTPAREFALTTSGAEYVSRGAIGQEYFVSGLVFNQGYETIQSFDVEVTSNGNITTESFTDLEIKFFDAYKYTLSQSITITEGVTRYDVAIKNVNGDPADDSATANNDRTFSINGIEVTEGKAVVIEEGTGTWCGWCPRGTIFLDEMSKRFGDHFVGIAVHNSDPMQVGSYNSAIENFDQFLGFPSVILQRNRVLDPDGIENPSIQVMEDVVVASLKTTATFDETTRAFSPTIEVTIMEDMTADHNISVVLTEDGVIGTDGAWGQTNYYSGGSEGNMGGFEFLGGKVTNDFLTYDHVARALIGGWAGQGEVVTGDLIAGDVISHTFADFVINEDYNTDNMHVVAIITDSDNEVVDARSVKFSEAIGEVTSVDNVYNNSLEEVFPNPAFDHVNIAMGLPETASINATLYTNLGEKVNTLNFGKQVGNTYLRYDVGNVNPGIYYLHIQIDNKLVTKKVTIAN